MPSEARTHDHCVVLAGGGRQLPPASRRHQPQRFLGGRATSAPESGPAAETDRFGGREAYQPAPARAAPRPVRSAARRTRANRQQRDSPEGPFVAALRSWREMLCHPALSEGDSPPGDRCHATPRPAGPRSRPPRPSGAHVRSIRSPHRFPGAPPARRPGHGAGLAVGRRSWAGPRSPATPRPARPAPAPCSPLPWPPIGRRRVPPARRSIGPRDRSGRAAETVAGALQGLEMRSMSIRSTPTRGGHRASRPTATRR